MPRRSVEVNRAPVLTLWAAVVAERLGYDREAALTLGKTVAGLNAQSKGRRLGIYGEPEPPGERPKAAAEARARGDTIPLLGREVPVLATPEGLRAVAKDRPESPAAVERYLEQKFGDALAEVRAALTALARAYRPAQLAEDAYSLYEQFRPQIPAGVKGWGVKGTLDLDHIRELASPGGGR
jgi:hypothetical protein